MSVLLKDLSFDGAVILLVYPPLVFKGAAGTFALVNIYGGDRLRNPRVRNSGVSLSGNEGKWRHTLVSIALSLNFAF